MSDNKKIAFVFAGNLSPFDAFVTAAKSADTAQAADHSAAVTQAQASCFMVSESIEKAIDSLTRAVPEGLTGKKLEDAQTARKATIKAKRNKFTTFRNAAIACTDVSAFAYALADIGKLSGTVRNNLEAFSRDVLKIESPAPLPAMRALVKKWQDDDRAAVAQAAKAAKDRKTANEAYAKACKAAKAKGLPKPARPAKPAKADKEPRSLHGVGVMLTNARSYARDLKHPELAEKMAALKIIEDWFLAQK